jgi:hypothetical protein
MITAICNFAQLLYTPYTPTAHNVSLQADKAEPSSTFRKDVQKLIDFGRLRGIESPKGSPFPGAQCRSSVSGNSYGGTWDRGTVNGHGSFQRMDEKECYIGNWKDGQLSGHGACWLENNTFYTGGWECGQMHGRGTVVSSDGSIYEGVWKNGQISDISKIIFVDGIVNPQLYGRVSYT